MAILEMKPKSLDPPPTPEPILLLILHLHLPRQARLGELGQLVHQDEG